MSEIAEFARQLHQTCSPGFYQDLKPVDCPSRSEKLTDIHAVIFDVYGTLINYWRPGLDDKEKRSRLLKAACREVSDRFGFAEYLSAMNPDEDPEKTLYDLYCGCIALNLGKTANKDMAFSEVKVEEIWNMILLMLKRRGYDPKKTYSGPTGDLSRYVAYTYNFFSLGRNLYPGVVDTLVTLKKRGMALGIASNAQFYTPIDLTLLLRDQSGGACDDLLELFEPNLTFFSYEHNVAAKPDFLLFRRLFDELYELAILPQQTVFVGNDLVLDIEPAEKAGMKTAFFSGDRQSAYFHDKNGTIIPDIVFSSWHVLPQKLSF